METPKSGRGQHPRELGMDRCVHSPSGSCWRGNPPPRGVRLTGEGPPGSENRPESETPQKRLPPARSEASPRPRE